MMFFLVHHVIIDLAYLAMPVGKSTVAFLPLKFPFYKSFFVDPFRGFALYYLHQIRNGLCGVQTNEEVNMVGHTIDGNHFMLMILYNPSCVFEKLFFPRWLNQANPILNGKYKLNVELGKGVGHGAMIWLEHSVPTGRAFLSKIRLQIYRPWRDESFRVRILCK